MCSTKTWLVTLSSSVPSPSGSSIIWFAGLVQVLFDAGTKSAQADVCSELADAYLERLSEYGGDDN